MRARTLLLTLALLGLLPAGTAAAASSKFTIRGAGFGHGVGMSQYGAYGFALNGSGYRDILAHYYTDTAIGSLDPKQRVRVLLQSVRGSASVTGAVRAGRRRLSARKTYYVRRRGAAVQLLNARRKKIGTYSTLRVTGRGGMVTLKGRAANGRVNGAYRGAIHFSPGAFTGVDAVNALPLDTYLRGVVPDESPPSWPLEALKAQAVAARTYAVATMKPGAGFDLYPDTRSQVYKGVGIETASTNAAVAATRGQIVTYNGQPVVTYFFSTSGGKTEDVENTTLGNEPRPWLKSVDDEYDGVSPRHRWTTKLTMKSASRKLGSLVKGSFKGIRVTRRGASPRIMAAEIVGSRGTTTTDGATLRAKFGLFDTWAYFAAISGKKAPASDAPGADGSGGATIPPRSFSFRPPRVAGVMRGTVIGGGAHGVIQQRRDGRWADIARVTARHGAYRYVATSAGTYRAVFGGAAGPAVRL